MSRACRAIRRAIALAGLGAASLGDAGAALVNPLAVTNTAQPGGSAPSRSPAADSCFPAIAPVSGIEGQRYYVDRRSTSIDRDLLARNLAIVAPLNAFATGVARATARFLASRGRDAASAACVIQALDGWAKADALGGGFNEQGLGHRRWIVNAIAVDFLAIRGTPGLDADAEARIARWLGRQGDAIIATIGDVRNNHLYWGAAAVAATAIASDDRRKLDWAVAAARRGLNDVDANGALPLEMKRGPRALNYHAFALEPLVEVAGFAKANGIDLYAENDRALSRLAAFVATNLADSSQIKRLSGADQILDASMTDMLSWTEQYHADTGDCAIGRIAASHRPLAKGYLGGDTTLLFGGKRPDCG